MSKHNINPVADVKPELKGEGCALSPAVASASKHEESLGTRTDIRRESVDSDHINAEEMPGKGYPDESECRPNCESGYQISDNTSQINPTAKPKHQPDNDYRMKQVLPKDKEAKHSASQFVAQDTTNPSETA
jgi:hypothetical protein